MAPIAEGNPVDRGRGTPVRQVEAQVEGSRLVLRQLAGDGMARSGGVGGVVVGVVAAAEPAAC